MRTWGIQGTMIAIAGESLIGGIAGKERRTGKSACATGNCSGGTYEFQIEATAEQRRRPEASGTRDKVRRASKSGVGRRGLGYWRRG